MAYSLDPLQDGCYENSSVLINKFDIRDEKELEMLERNLTSYLMAQATIEIPFEDVNFEFYKNLHKYVFGEIYDWAGTIRKVDMSKSGTKFCPANEIEKRGKNIFDRLETQNYLKGFKGEEFINEFVDLYCELNYLHPFREGNGRIQRQFLLMLLNNMGKHIDFKDIDRDLLMIATIKSVKGDLFMLKDIFREHIDCRS
ncbi:MAG: Fic family protein [Clostridia bacterium]|nr:Fic family protein [Clostridia bacterium]